MPAPSDLDTAVVHLNRLWYSATTPATEAKWTIVANLLRRLSPLATPHDRFFDFVSYADFVGFLRQRTSAPVFQIGSNVVDLAAHRASRATKNVTQATEIVTTVTEPTQIEDGPASGTMAQRGIGATIALILLALWPSPAPAMEPRPVRAAVAACVAEVRQRPRSQTEPSAFEAFYDERLRAVHWLGTGPEEFHFRRCLLERGISIADKPPITAAPKEIRQ